MEYSKNPYISKINSLQEVFDTSVRLSEAIGVSRRTLLNWRDRPESMKSEYQFEVDVLYCKHIIIPDWDEPKQVFKAPLLPDDMQHNERLFLPFIRNLSYGTVEIESPIDREDFDRAIDNKKLPKNMSREAFHESINAFFTHQWLWKKIVGCHEKLVISEDSIRSLHADFMRGVYENAGFYSKHIRVLGKLSGLDTTLPEDIPEEMNRWIYTYAKASTLEDIAKAHAYFISIHPFGDGNGRVGRALVMIQCLHARLLPPIFNGDNRAMYYAAMEHAIVHGRYVPLIRLFHGAAGL